MRKVIELIETICEFEIYSPNNGAVTSKIHAEVQCFPTDDEMLVIKFSPDYNGYTEVRLPFDHSKLPRKMVEEWFAQQFDGLRMTNSNLKEHEMEITN